MIALLVISVMMSLIIILQANKTDEQSVKAERRDKHLQRGRWTRQADGWSDEQMDGQTEGQVRPTDIRTNRKTGKMCNDDESLSII